MEVRLCRSRDSKPSRSAAVDGCKTPRSIRRRRTAPGWGGPAARTYRSVDENSYCSASMAIMVAFLVSAIVVGTGLGEVTCHGSTVKGHVARRTSF